MEKLRQKNLDELLFRLQNIPKIEENNSKVINLENAEIGYIQTETVSLILNLYRPFNLISSPILVKNT